MRLLAVLLIGVIALPAAAKTYDYTSEFFAEVDTYGELSRTATEVTIVKASHGLNSNAPYLWKGAAQDLVGNFTLEGEVLMEAGATDGFRVSPVMLAERADGQYAISAGAGTEGYALGFMVLNASGTLYFQMYEYATGANPTPVNVAANPTAGVRYYWRFRRDESVGTYGTAYLDVFTDAGRTVSFGSATLTLANKRNFTHLYAATGYEHVAGGAGTARIANLTLTSSLDESRGKIIGVPPGGSYAAALAAPRQRRLWYDGRHTQLFFNGPAAEALVQFRDLLVDEMGVPHRPPKLDPTMAPRAWDAWFDFTPGYADMNVAAAGYTYPTAKSDRSISASYSYRAQQTFSALAGENSVATDGDEYAWAAGRALSGGDLVIYRGTGPNNEAAFSLSLTVEATAATNAAPQLVVYENGDVGLLYSLDLVLAYRHWTRGTATWGDAETIVSDLGSYDNWRGVVARDGTLTVQYRRNGAAGLLGKRRPLGGALGSEITIASDITGAATTYYHTSCVDAGRPDVVYVAYYDGTDLKYRVITSGSVGAAQTLLAGASLANSGLLAPPYDSHKIIFAYQHTTGGIYALAIDVTPPLEYAGSGVGLDFNSVNNFAAVQVATDWPISFVVQLTRGGYSRGRLRNEETGQWVGDWETLTRRYWDVHDTMVLFRDDAGRAYLFEGGRNHAAADRVTPMTLWRTAGRVNSYASAAALWAARENVSPPTTGYFDVVSGNRGYKQVVVGHGADEGVVYLMWQHASGTKARHLIAEYRGGAWSAPTVLVEYDVVLPYLSWNYGFGYTAGNEVAPAQTSIHIIWQVRDDSTPTTGGSLLIVEQSYAKVVPQGDGSFKAYRIDGAEMTLPMTLAPDRKDLIYSGRPANTTLAPAARANSTAYSLNAVVNGGNGHLYRVKVAGTSGGSAPTWPTDHYATVVDGGVTWEEHGLAGAVYVDTFTGNALSAIDGRFMFTAAFRNFVEGNGPACTLTEMRLWKWTGTAWSSHVVQSAAMPWRGYQHIIVSPNAAWIPYRKTVAGVEEIVLYRTADDGGSFSSKMVTSGSAKDQGEMVISSRTSGSTTLGWFSRQHRGYAEGVFETMPLGTPVYFRARIKEANGTRRSSPSQTLIIYH
jgi:hypothetical protein